MGAATSGILDSLVVSEGDTVEVGSLLAIIVAGEKTGQRKTSVPKQENKKIDEQISEPNKDERKGSGMDVLVPVLGESVVEATVSKWIKKQGEFVEVDEPIVELETDKVTLEVPAAVSGILDNLAVSEGDTVEVGALLCS